MKKRYFILGIVVDIAISLGIWLFIQPKKLGSISRVYAEPENSSSNISFSGEAGDKIKFSFASNVEEGELDIVVYDSEGKVVKELDRAKELVTYLTLESSDTYTLEAVYKEFVGNFEVVVYKVEGK